MAKSKTKSKAKTKSPLIGHNSDAQQRRDELLKVAKAQRQLDKDKAAARADFKERHDKLTGRLKEVGISRQAFAQPYSNFLRLADAENDTEAKKAQEDNKMYLAQQRVAYDALSAGQTIDWIDLIQDADEIAKMREEEERQALADAEANVPDAEDSGAAE